MCAWAPVCVFDSVCIGVRVGMSKHVRVRVCVDACVCVREYV